MGSVRARSGAAIVRQLPTIVLLLAILLAIRPVPAVAQSVSVGPSTSRTWPGYRPGTTWSHYQPGQAWSGYGSVRSQSQSPSVIAGRHIHPAPSGWAGYAPARAWTHYQPGVAWQSYTPAGGRSVLNMNHARVSGPSPYADGRPRSYHEYGTGRPVPLAKPWLRGSP
jgi:hypothetical protein